MIKRQEVQKDSLYQLMEVESPVYIQNGKKPASVSLPYSLNRKV
jgi:hypothetical protein